MPTTLLEEVENMREILFLSHTRLSELLYYQDYAVFDQTAKDWKSFIPVVWVDQSENF